MALPEITNVAVVDDDDEAAMTLIHVLEDGAFKPFRQEARATLDELVNSIIEGSDAAVCDHLLRYGGFADTSGAELAARLVGRGHPTILVTQYLDQYADIEIRKFRSNLPVVLRREEADEPEELRDAFTRCSDEIEKGRLDSRTPQRTLLRVEQITRVDGTGVVDAIVHGWNSKDTVRFPLDLIHPDDRDQVVEKSTLVAFSNIRAEEKVELFFENIRLAPDLDEGDGLG